MLGVGLGAGSKDLFFKAYLFGYVFWACLTFGLFGLSLLRHSLKANWGFPMIRLFEAGGGATALGLLGLLFLPIIAGMPSLYGRWMNPGDDKVILGKIAYLNQPFWIARTLIVLAAFALVAYLNAKWTREQEKTHNKELADKRATLSAPSLILFVLAGTFLSTDWVMSLDPHWFSTMYGVWFVAGQALAGLALGAAIVAWHAAKRPYEKHVHAGYFKDIGNLLLAFTMFWAYISFSQYLIIWSGNLPEFNGYYLDRLRGGWNVVGTLLIVGQFFVPFVLLLSPRMKRTPAMLAGIAIWILLMRVVDLYYIIVPHFQADVMPSLGEFGMYAGAFIGIGGIWLAHFAWRLQHSPLVPDFEPVLAEVESHA